MIIRELNHSKFIHSTFKIKPDDTPIMKKLHLLFSFFLLTLLFFSCLNDEPTEELIVEGLRPVYIMPEAADSVMSLPPQPITQLGKIYYKDNLIYVGERGQGVHIIDNTNPEDPIRMGFIQIPGNKDIVIKDNLMYADNYADLLTIDISDLDNVQEINRVEGVYPLHPQSYPDFYTGYFECIDPEKGFVMRWESVTLTNPACQR